MPEGRKPKYTKTGEPSSYARPSRRALASLEGHPNKRAILDIIRRAPDEFDRTLDGSGVVPLDSQAGYWERLEDDYSEESFP